MKLFSRKNMDGNPKEDDVPGELPALGDVAGDAKGADGVPDELPNLDAPAAPAQQPATATPTPKQSASAAEASGSSAALPAAAHEEKTSAEKAPQLRPTSPQEYQQDASGTIRQDYPSFFAEAINVGSPMANGNLLSAMKKYWDKNRLLEVPHKSDIVNETEVAIQAEVSKLKELEKAWLAKMKDYNILKQNIAYLETEISTHSEELATLLKSSKHHMFVKQMNRIKKAEKASSIKPRPSKRRK